MTDVDRGTIYFNKIQYFVGTKNRTNNRLDISYDFTLELRLRHWTSINRDYKVIYYI